MESARGRAAVLLVLGAVAALGFTINEHYRNRSDRNQLGDVANTAAQTRVELPLAGAPAAQASAGTAQAPAGTAQTLPGVAQAPAGTIPTPAARPQNAQIPAPRPRALTQATVARAHARPRAEMHKKHGYRARHGRYRHRDAAPPVEMAYYPRPYESYPPYGDDYSYAEPYEFMSEPPVFQGEGLNGRLNLSGLNGGVGSGAAYGGGGGGGGFFAADPGVNLGAQAVARAAAVNRLARRVR